MSSIRHRLTQPEMTGSLPNNSAGDIIPRTTHLALYYHCPLVESVPPVPEIDRREVSDAAWVSGPEALPKFTSDVASAIAAFLRGPV